MPVAPPEDSIDTEGVDPQDTAPPQAAPQTRTVVGPNGSIYMAGPYSRYNSDPTQIPAQNPQPPVYPPGYTPWQPPPRDPEQEQVDQWQKDLATGALNPQEVQAAMVAQKGALKLIHQRQFSTEFENAKTDQDRVAIIAKHGPWLFGDSTPALLKAITPQRPAPSEVTVPANPETGIPAHIISRTGSPHFAPQVRQQPEISALERIDLTSRANAVKSAQRAYSAAVAGGDEGSIGATRKALEDAQKEYGAFRSGLKPRKPSPYPEGTVLSHKDGSKWVVRGGEAVPLKSPTSETADSSDEETDTEE